VTFTFADLVKLYEKKREAFGAQTFRYISSILKEAKLLHKEHFEGNDHEQSWRAFKGKNLEKLIVYILDREVRELGLELVQGHQLERNSNLPSTLANVKSNLLLDYGAQGKHLPDVDIIIFDPADSNVLAVLSVKVTLRERIAQTGYWKLKLLNNPLTEGVKVYFVTPDEDCTLAVKIPAKKGRAIVEVDTDGSYVMSENAIEESEHVKTFDKLILDLKTLLDLKHKE
jgi:type II restriction enzyme